MNWIKVFKKWIQLNTTNTNLKSTQEVLVIDIILLRKGHNWLLWAQNMHVVGNDVLYRDSPSLPAFASSSLASRPPLGWMVALPPRQEAQRPRGELLGPSPGLWWWIRSLHHPRMQNRLQRMGQQDSDTYRDINKEGMSLWDLEGTWTMNLFQDQLATTTTIQLQLRV